MPKPKSVRLKTPDAELEFAVQPSTTGKLLFEQVAKTIALREVWYFGIRYTNSKGELDWIKLNKKVIGGHDLRKQDPIDLELKIKFYPEEAEEELIQDITKRYFYMEIKRAILSEEIYCTAPTSVLLASYACQEKFGDYDESIKIEDSKLLPLSITKKHTLSAGEWAEKIIEAWKPYKDMFREEAMVEYIKVAQELDMYGVNYFEIKNRKNTELLLGVDSQGLNVYEKADKLNPRIGFPWSEIRNISFNDKKFIIKSIDRKAPDFIFFTTSLRTCKRILSLCMGNHELYTRRRKTDTIEVQQMKAQAKEVKDYNCGERERKISLRTEKEESERKRKRMEEEMEELRLRQMELEENLSRKEQEREESERKARELETLKQEQEDEMKRLDEKRENLELELHHQREEFAVKSAEENERINEQLKQMQKEKDELQTQIHITSMEQKRQKEQYDIREREVELKLRGLSPQTSVDEDAQAFSVDMVQQGPSIRIVEPEEQRKAKYGSQNKQLQDLSAELAQFEKRDELSPIDMIYKDNVEKGRDRYKTLRDIRKGNTKHRVELFESC